MAGIIADQAVQQFVSGPAMFWVTFAGGNGYPTTKPILFGTCEVAPVIQFQEKYYRVPYGGGGNCPVVDSILLGKEVLITGVFNNVNESLLISIRNTCSNWGGAQQLNVRQDGIFQRTDIGTLMIRGGIGFRLYVSFECAAQNIPVQAIGMNQPIQEQGWTFFCVRPEGDSWHNLTTVPRDCELTFRAEMVYVPWSKNSIQGAIPPIIADLPQQFLIPGTWLLYAMNFVHGDQLVPENAKDSVLQTRALTNEIIGAIAGNASVVPVP